ncbi:MAG: methyltransferase domain-containing protein, partial [Myxococcales bacterium]|nr:methyltransferase domain-containing protein [Myxococcales bacterium]
MTRMHRVVVGPLPCWLDREQLLAVPHTATELPMGDVEVSAELTSLQAADLAARLRGLCLAARPIQVRCEPPLPRAAVRSARAEDARRRRETTAGFERRGVLVDDPEGRWSLTPEALALEMAGLAGQCSVCDAMCGLGGNAIAFARAGCEVTAIELDAARLARARHNARVYGVLERIRFIHGDARSLLGDMDAALLFLDPPWGVKWNR